MTERFYTNHTAIEKARALYERGVMLAERADGFYKQQLYQYNGVYFEVTWHVHFNVVVKVSRFDSVDRLEPYLACVSLDGLF